MNDERFDRHMALLGRDGQIRLRRARVAVVGIGGIGSHLVQQLAFLGVGRISLIDPQELAMTDRNRHVLSRHEDPIPGTPKVKLAARAVATIDPEIELDTIQKSLISEEAFAGIVASDYVFGCVDLEGLRLVLNELCAAYSRPYFDLASDVVPGDPPTYGGRVCIAFDGNGCLVCYGLLDAVEAQTDLLTPSSRRDRAAIYGIKREALGRSGPSVVSINGAIASLAATEFMVTVTGLRAPKRVFTWYAHMGRLTAPSEPPAPNCYYCIAVRGRGDAADVHRYIREGIGVDAADSVEGKP